MALGDLVGLLWGEEVTAEAVIAENVMETGKEALGSFEVLENGVTAASGFEPGRIRIWLDRERRISLIDLEGNDGSFRRIAGPVFPDDED